jgi:ankyrin repeat protein
MVEFLVENGADVNAVDDDGETGLSNAYLLGHHEVVKFLEAHGAEE